MEDRRTETELYRAFLDGDPSSYDELMLRLGDALTAYLYSYLRDWQEAENLMIEAFARIMVKKPHIRGGNFKAYLYKTARNLASKFYHQKMKRQTISLESLEAELPGGDHPEESALKEERKKALYRCMERVDPDLKEVLRLLYFEEMSYEEAAAVFHVNKKRIDHLAERARKEMRKELAKEGITDAFE